MHNITKYQLDELQKEVSEIMGKTFEDNSSLFTRERTDAEKERLKVITEVIKNCKIVD